MKDIIEFNVTKKTEKNFPTFPPMALSPCRCRLERMGKTFQSFPLKRDAGLWSDDNGHIIKAMTFTLGDVTHDKKYHLRFDIYAGS